MSDTPKTDESMVGTVTRHGVVFEVALSESMRALERQHNALIAKLEALANALHKMQRTGHAVAYGHARTEIKRIIQESKQ